MEKLCIAVGDKMISENGFPELSQINNSQLFIFESLDSLSISVLHLPLRISRSLQRFGITTIGELFGKEFAELPEIPNISTNSAKKINKIKNTLISSVDGNELNWSHYWNKLGITLVPSGMKSDTFPSEIISSITQIIKEILQKNSDARMWPIIQRRFGFDGTTELTLQELADVFQLSSRERIRQLEDRALNELREVFIDNEYSGKDYHVHPQVLKTIRELFAIVAEKAVVPIMEQELLDSINKHCRSDFEKQKPVLFMLLKIRGLEQIKFDNPNLISLWGFYDNKRKKWIKRSIERLDNLLTKETPRPMNKIDILLNVNRGARKNAKLSMEQLTELLLLCSSIEEYKSGIFWGKFACLRGRGNQVERILIEYGEPVHIREISREINHRSLTYGKHIIDQNSLANQISVDDRFIPIGRSGEWALTSWAHIDTSTIVELMEQCFIVNNKPVSADVVYSYVSDRRSVNKKSVEVYLATNASFVRVNKETWGLASWKESQTAQAWNPKQVALFVETVFKENRAEILPYATIREALMQAAEFSNRQVAGMLNVNPVIVKQRDPDTGELCALFQPDYRDVLAKTKARIGSKRKTLRQQVAEDVQLLLERSPGKQMALAELMEMLKDKFHQKTFYSYVSGLDFVEKYVIPDTNVTMCRLKYNQEALPFSQVDDIKSPGLKSKIGRCLSFLNENDVDIALFLLSKEFEETLKSYLTLAQSKGKYPHLSGRLSLDMMINFITKEGLITDQAILHFLRQKRNDRAHGTMPTVEERIMMMKYAEVTAGMYIDYIKFFDDLSQTLK